MTKPKAKSGAQSVKAIPDGYHAVTPYLIVRGGAAAIDFYRAALGAEELFRIDMGGGKLGHAEIRIGDSVVMLADEHPEMGCKAPSAYGGTPVSLTLYVEDVDARVRRAVEAGAKLLRPVQDQFYGDRSGTVLDPFGHVWTIATHKEDLSPDEIARRAEALHG
jgi:PhnB protein